MKKFKYNSILFHLFISYALFVFLLILIGSGLNRIESYSVLFLISSMSIIYLCFQFYFLFGVNVLMVGIFGFYTKLLIGYMFWQFYMWPDYFSNPSSVIVFDHYEYLIFGKNAKLIAEYRINHGFFSINKDFFDSTSPIYQNKYIFLNYIISHLFMSGNFNLLDFSIQNSLFSVYSSIIISLIGLKLGCTKKQAKIIFIIALFQPFSFISVMIWRDVVGQFFVFFGVYLLLQLNEARFIKLTMMLLFSSISMSFLRTIYIFVPIFIYSANYFRLGMNNVRKSTYFLIILAFGLFVIFQPSLIAFIKYGYMSYIEKIDILKFILLLPINILRFLIGPFPWINWFNFDDNHIFLIGNYLQAVYVIVITFFTAKYYKLYEHDFKFYLVLLCLIFLFMSMSGPEINNSYFSFCIALLLPISAKYMSLKKFYVYYFLFFSGYIILNIIYVFLGFHGSNLGAYL